MNIYQAPISGLDIVGFRNTLTAYTEQMSTLGKRLISIAAEACNAKPNELMPAFNLPTTWLRLLHYPPSPILSPDDLYGSAPHTDFGALTLLAQDGIGGLQVQTPHGDWIDVPKIDGTFVVNVGDMLNRLSNGLLKSTPHRVINRSGKERYSIPFFFDPHVNTIIKPLKGTGDPHLNQYILVIFCDLSLAQVTTATKNQLIKHNNKILFISSY